jgi:hypothetical protein
MPTQDRQVFSDLAARFCDQFELVRDCVDRRYVRPDWAERNAMLERDLLASPGDFLRHPSVRFQMFVDERTLPHELPYTRARLGRDDLLEEDAVGEPPTVALPGSSVRTSSNTVHQLYHLLRYEDATGRRVSDADIVVEWGGGFGSLMRLLVRMHGGHPTCIIFDTPIFSALQWFYLSSVLGEERVVLHGPGPVRLVAGKVNLLPIGLLGNAEISADLFISNWALNESMPAAQREVISRNWFGAKSLLLAMHAGDPLTEVAREAAAEVVPLGDFMPGQQYLVA